MVNNIELSIVIPVFNEEDNLQPLLEELTGVLYGINRSYEIICVNDGSTDKSKEVLENCRLDYPQLKIVNHVSNCGESAAEASGFRTATGEYIVTIDADMQNDPHDIPSMIEMLIDPVVCVCGVRKKRNDSFLKRISSKIANAFRNIMTGDRIQDAGCTFRVMRRSVLREVLVFNGMHRFLPTILRAQGFSVAECEVNHRYRHKGYSKYGVNNRLWRGILDCLAIRWYLARAIPLHRIKQS